MLQWGEGEQEQMSWDALGSSFVKKLCLCKLGKVGRNVPMGMFLPLALWKPWLDVGITASSPGRGSGKKWPGWLIPVILLPHLCHHSCFLVEDQHGFEFQCAPRSGRCSAAPSVLSPRELQGLP